MDLSPVSFDQIISGIDGRQYEVSGWAGDVARQLQELEPSLRVQYNEAGDFFAVQQVVDAGGFSVAEESDTTQRKCVGTFLAGEWGPKVVKEFEMRCHELRNGISAAERLDASDARRAADNEHAFDEMVRERAYPLFRAFQRDIFGANPRAFIAGRRTRNGYARAT